MFGEDAYQNCLVDKNRFDIRRFNSSQISPPTTSIDQVVDMSRERIGNGNDRRQPRNYRRQEWIPRGSTPSIPPPFANININTPFASNSRLDANHHHPPNNRSHNVSKSHFIPSTRGRGSGVVNHQHQQNMNIVNANNSNRRKGESLLPHLVQEIQDKLLKGSIECMICYDMVRRTASIWNRQDPPSDLYLTPHSCGEPCGRPLDKDHRVGNHEDDDRDDGRCHHRCVLVRLVRRLLHQGYVLVKWARAPTSIDLSAQKNQGFNWRGPGCQSVQLTSDDGRCRHRCVVQCHPGPCPPCKAFAPPRICPCGKKTIPTRCSDQKSLLTCGQRCGKPLKCLRHCCYKTCHVGPCDSCDVQIDASCFCKKKIEVVVCGDMAVKGHANVENDGIFSCNSSCGKPLGCGNHVCKETCHPGVCGDCELLPGRITTVECFNTTTTMTDEFKCDKPCGRKKNCGRHRCSDKCCPLSNSKNSAATQGWDPHLCSKPCEKKLRCGQHDCETLCHSGHCPPCQETIFTDLTCACGRSSIPPPLPCGTPPPSCQYPCSVPQPCGHPSSHSCHFGDCPPCSVPIPKECIGGHVVLRNIPCGSKDIRCNKLCGKMRHGHCPPCQETIFTDLTCACGRSSIPPPLPCGTPPPSCQYPCSVPQPCGHPSSHSCHFGDCPPCSVPIPKECIGGHVVLRNIPCGSKDIRCNKLCGKTRQCGMHTCLRTCHPSPCDSSSSSSGGSTFGVKASCGQTCGAPRRDCRHTCTSLCHPHNTCPDVR
ncbi:NF-X1-type zinc finger protein NFXL1, partial [Tanacetum coccineum]